MDAETEDGRSYSEEWDCKDGDGRGPVEGARLTERRSRSDGAGWDCLSGDPLCEGEGLMTVGASPSSPPARNRFAAGPEKEMIWMSSSESSS